VHVNVDQTRTCRVYGRVRRGEVKVGVILRLHPMLCAQKKEGKKAHVYSIQVSSHDTKNSKYNNTNALLFLSAHYRYDVPSAQRGTSPSWLLVLQHQMLNRHVLSSVSMRGFLSKVTFELWYDMCRVCNPS
jgi:hypothetical protein